MATVPVRSGIPQGFVLGPSLLLLYIDELHKIIHDSNIKLFADDIVLCKEIVLWSSSRGSFKNI